MKKWRKIMLNLKIPVLAITVAGFMTILGIGIATPPVLAADSISWSPLGTNSPSDASSSVNGLVYIDGTLFAGTAGIVVGGHSTWAYYKATNLWSPIGINSPGQVNCLGNVNGVLYAGTNMGLWSYNTTTNTWIFVNGSPGNINKFININGTLYVGALSGVFSYDLNRNTWTHVGTNSPNVVFSLLYMNGNLYAGTNNGSNDIWTYSVSTNTWSHVGSNAPSYVDSLQQINGTLFAGSIHSVYTYNSSENLWSQLGSSLSNVRSLLNVSGILYAGTSNSTNNNVFAYDSNTNSWVLVGIGSKPFFDLIIANGILYGGGYGNGHGEGGFGVWSLPLTDIDRIPPSTQSSVYGKQGENGWYLGPVQLSLSASDNKSGVTTTYYSTDGGTAWQTYSSPVIFSSDGKYIIQYYSVDNAGNKETPETLRINIDQTPPTVSVASPTNDSNDSEDLTPQFTVTDNFSGVDIQKTIATMDGLNVQHGMTIPLYTLPLGPHTFALTSSDLAGNARSVTVTFQTYANLDSISALVTRFASNKWIDNAGITKSLQKKLNKGNIGEFMHEVQAQSGKHITKDAANYLLRDSQAIINSLKAMVNQFKNNKAINNAELAIDLLEALNEGDLKDFAQKVKEESGKHISSDAAKSLLQGLVKLLDNIDNNNDNGDKVNSKGNDDKNDKGYT